MGLKWSNADQRITKPQRGHRRTNTKHNEHKVRMGDRRIEAIHPAYYATWEP